MAQVRLTAEYMHPPELVWRALTDARLLTDWFMPTDLAPEPGHRFRLYPGTLPGFLGPVEGEVAEVVPLLRLVTLWRGETMHTRVVWELSDRGGRGCRLRVAQSGFLGTTATLRSEALFDTYARLFTGRLPVMLASLTGEPRAADRVAAWRTPRPADSSELSAMSDTADPPVPVPRQPSGTVMPTGSHAHDVVDEGATQVLPLVPAQAVIPPEERSAARRLGRLGRPGRPRRPRRPGRAPTLAGSFARNVLVGVGAAVVAAVVVTAATYVPSGDHGEAPEGRTPPGVAMQPGRTTPAADDGGDAPPHNEHVAPGRDPFDEAAGVTHPDAAGGEPTVSPGASTSPEPGSGGESSDPASASPTPSPESTLTAAYDVDTPLLGGRSVEVTVHNEGPGAVDEWQVTFDVHGQDVVDVTGADHEQQEDEAVFTPVTDELSADEDVEFTFRLRATLLGLVGGRDPSDCTIDGEPCE